MFSGAELGAGFKTLQGQGLSDKELRSAENEVLKRFGITGNGALSDTTPEQEALKAEGRDLSRTLGDIAGQGAQFDVSEIAVANATITITDAIFQDKLAEISKQGEGLAK